MCVIWLEVERRRDALLTLYNLAENQIVNTRGGDRGVSNFLSCAQQSPP